MNELIKKIKDYYCHLTETKYYWYEVKYVYRTEHSGKILFDYKSIVGLRKQKTILNKRTLKKITTPLHIQNSTKRLVCNGNFDVEVVCYLGKMGRNEK